MWKSKEEGVTGAIGPDSIGQAFVECGKWGRKELLSLPGFDLFENSPEESKASRFLGICGFGSPSITDSF